MVGARAQVKLDARPTLRLTDLKTARAVDKATGVDNPQSGLRQSVAGARLQLEARPASPASLRATLDDWLRCAAAAAEAARHAK
jgi:hypothetical protein